MTNPLYHKFEDGVKSLRTPLLFHYPTPFRDNFPWDDFNNSEEVSWQWNRGNVGAYWADGIVAYFGKWVITW